MDILTGENIRIGTLKVFQVWELFFHLKSAIRNLIRTKKNNLKLVFHICFRSFPQVLIGNINKVLIIEILFSYSSLPKIINQQNNIKFVENLSNII